MAMTLRSEAFQEGAPIPVKYSCQGDRISPPLHWGGTPQRVGSYALIVEDPDAPGGTFTHWLLYDLNPNTDNLGQGVPSVPELPDGAAQGMNGFGKTGYSAPCPPPGPAHHYRFTVYALDTLLNLHPGASKEQLLRAMQGHIADQGTLVGLYARS